MVREARQRLMAEAQAHQARHARVAQAREQLAAEVQAFLGRDR
jgi:hypothetical protein